jgi:hypothetical protein
MKYLKIYEKFRQPDIEVLEPEVELSDKTIDDVLDPNFFSDIEEEESYIDSKGVIHIKNWNQY